MDTMMLGWPGVGRVLTNFGCEIFRGIQNLEILTQVVTPHHPWEYKD